MKFSKLYSLAALTLLTGCAHRLYFTTHSSVGLDVSGTANYPDHVSFSSSRYEYAYVPPAPSPEGYPVYGGQDMDVTWFHGHQIKQVFATGEAAITAARTNETDGDDNSKDGKSAESTREAKEKPLMFFTASSYGLDLNAGKNEFNPTLLLGYRRTEGTMIPIPKGATQVRPVYADIDINAKGWLTSDSDYTNKLTSVSTNFSQIGGVRIKQGFATGRAAILLAESAPVKAKLAKAAGTGPAGEGLVTARSLTDSILTAFDKSSPDDQTKFLDWLITTFPSATDELKSSKTRLILSRVTLPKLANLGKLEEVKQHLTGGSQ